MPKVYVGIGSNLCPERHILLALTALRAVYRHPRCSSVYASAASGDYSGEFLNLVVGFDTTEPVERVHRRLRRIESFCGRVRDGVKRRRLPLDLDLLLYGDRCGVVAGRRLPRSDVAEQSFVLGPLAEIAGDERHPVFGTTFRTLWARFPREAQPLRHIHWKDVREIASTGPVAPAASDAVDRVGWGVTDAARQDRVVRDKVNSGGVSTLSRGY